MHDLRHTAFPSTVLLVALLLIGCQRSSSPSNTAVWRQDGDRHIHTVSPIFSFTYPSGVDFPTSRHPSLGDLPASDMTDERCTTDGICMVMSWQHAQNGFVAYPDAVSSMVNGHRAQEMTRFSNEGPFDILTEIEDGDWLLTIDVSDDSTTKKTPDARLLQYAHEVVKSIQFE